MASNVLICVSIGTDKWYFNNLINALESVRLTYSNVKYKLIERVHDNGDVIFQREDDGRTLVTLHTMSLDDIILTRVEHL